MNASDPILPEYLQTCFIPKGEGIDWPDEFWIITACNPYSSGVLEGDRDADRRLRRHLSKGGYPKFRIKGISADWQHEEKSYGVSGITRDVLLELGRQFQQNAVFHIIGDRLSVVACVDDREVQLGSFRERIRKIEDRPCARVYVIRLDEAVLNVKRFQRANPNHVTGMACYYVGMTCCTAEERFEQHQRGYKAATFAKRFGIELAHERFPTQEWLGIEAAKRLEFDHAEWLRGQGYAVWQH
ncbi:MAG: DUF3293 domain-containing protein [Akkermansiaceae bacterium]|nr:DUF3293 domain-containing protein [Akkermansiaceae bacterium]